MRPRRDVTAGGRSVCGRLLGPPLPREAEWRGLYPSTAPPAPCAAGQERRTSKWAVAQRNRGQRSACPVAQQQALSTGSRTGSSSQRDVQAKPLRHGGRPPDALWQLCSVCWPAQPTTAPGRGHSAACWAGQRRTGLASREVTAHEQYMPTAGYLVCAPALLHRCMNHPKAAVPPPSPAGRPHLTTASMRLPPASPAARSKGLSPHRQ